MAFLTAQMQLHQPVAKTVPHAGAILFFAPSPSPVKNTVVFSIPPPPQHPYVPQMFLIENSLYSRFSSVTDGPLKLKAPLGTNYTANPNDLMNAKKALNQLGYYDIPPHRGVDDWTDDATFDGIRSFQKDHRLKVDGLMRPGGPTESTINQRLAGLEGGQGEEPPGAATYRCSVCGAWHGGVYSPNVCWQCWGKGLR